jgi:hypothetical protein
MPQLLDDLAELPVGSHCLGLSASFSEATDHAVQFLAGTPEGVTPSYFVDDEESARRLNHRLAREVPAHVGCVVPLGHEQVERRDGPLRPAGEVLAFLDRHPEGVTAGGDTLSRYWTRETMADHLEYESWFEDQPRVTSRFLCPYDLRSMPIEDAPRILGELGRHHSHVVLSSSAEPAVRLLQLFVFGSPGEVPPRLEEDLGWARRNGLVAVEEPDVPFRLTAAGQQAVHEWSERTTVDW